MVTKYQILSNLLKTCNRCLRQRWLVTNSLGYISTLLDSPWDPLTNCKFPIHEIIIKQWRSDIFGWNTDDRTLSDFELRLKIIVIDTFQETFKRMSKY